ncbi:hypothetical protein OSTOST_01969, partial [Ostertagia ostertagi]
MAVDTRIHAPCNQSVSRTLARLISIHEYERNEQNERFLMLDNKHPLITITGRPGLPMRQLNDATNKAVKIRQNKRLGTNLGQERATKVADSSVQFAVFSENNAMIERSTARNLSAHLSPQRMTYCKKDWVPFAPPRGDKAYITKGSISIDAMNSAKLPRFIEAVLCSLIPICERASSQERTKKFMCGSLLKGRYQEYFQVLRVYVKSGWTYHSSTQLENH